MDKILEKWDEILSTVKHEHDISDISFDTWIRPLEVYGVEGSTLYILVPSEQMTLSYISKKYYLPLKVTIAELTGTEYEIKSIRAQKYHYSILYHSFHNPNLYVGQPPDNNLPLQYRT